MADLINSLSFSHFKVPLPEVLEDARHGDHTHFELITTTVNLSSGVSGTGYTYTGGRGGSSIFTMIKDDLAPALKGKDGEEFQNIAIFLERQSQMVCHSFTQKNVVILMEGITFFSQRQ